MNMELEARAATSRHRGLLRSLLWQALARFTDLISAASVVYAFVIFAWIAGRPGDEAFPGGEFHGVPVAVWNLPLAFFGVFWILIRGSLRYGASYLAWEAKRPYRGKLVYFGTQAIGLLLLFGVAAIFSVVGR